MERLTRDQALMSMAEVMARRGTCERLQVGVVFSKDGRIISTGYNGAPAGVDHCVHYSWTNSEPSAPKWLLNLTRENPDLAESLIPSGGVPMTVFYDGLTIEMRTGFNIEAPGCTYSQHAERNAIAFAARYGVALDGCDMHVTHMPCLDCAKSVINAGIKRVVYQSPYRITSGVDLLVQAGIQVYSSFDLMI